MEGAKMIFLVMFVLIGVLILFFGLVVIVAMRYTNTRIQMMTDLIAGLVLSTIDGGMILNSRRTIKSLV